MALLISKSNSFQYKREGGFIRGAYRIYVFVYKNGGDLWEAVYVTRHFVACVQTPLPSGKIVFSGGEGGGVCTQARHFGEILCQIFGLFTRICILLQTFNFWKFNTLFSNCLGSWQTSPLNCFHDWTTQKATCDRTFPSYCVVLDKMLHIWLFTLQLLAVPHLFQNTF